MKLPNYVSGRWSEGLGTGELLVSIPLQGTSWRVSLPRALILRPLFSLHALMADLRSASSPISNGRNCWARSPTFWRQIVTSTFGFLC